MQRSAKQEANQAANEGGKEVTGKVALEVAPKEVRRLPRPPLAPPAGAAGQQAAAGPHARPRVQLRGYEHTNHLTQEQAGAFRTIVDTYIPDLHDPAAVEVLLVLLEVCHILEVSDYRMRKIFGAAAAARLGDVGRHRTAQAAAPAAAAGVGMGTQHLPAQALSHRRRRHRPNLHPRDAGCRRRQRTRHQRMHGRVGAQGPAGIAVPLAAILPTAGPCARSTNMRRRGGTPTAGPCARSTNMRRRGGTPHRRTSCPLH